MSSFDLSVYHALSKCAQWDTQIIAVSFDKARNLVRLPILA